MLNMIVFILLKLCIEKSIKVTASVKSTGASLLLFMSLSKLSTDLSKCARFLSRSFF